MNWAAEFEARFRERYRRPPPWMRFVTDEELQPLAWEMSLRLKLDPPAGDLSAVVGELWERRKPRSDLDWARFCGATEPLSEAVARLGVPVDGVVFMAGPWISVVRENDADGAWVQMNMKDLVAFEEILWRDNSSIVHEHGDWVLSGPHDHPACLWRIPGEQRRSGP